MSLYTHLPIFTHLNNKKYLNSIRASTWPKILEHPGSVQNMMSLKYKKKEQFK